MTGPDTTHKTDPAATEPAETPELAVIPEPAPEAQLAAPPIRARVVVASNRASAGVYADTSGPFIAERLADLGCAVDDPLVVPDGQPVAEALLAAVEDGVDVVITSGGTGVNPSDRTPEMTRAVIDYEIPGIAEAIRAYGAPTVPTAILSRGVAGVAGRMLVVNLPGSRGGAKDGMAVLAPVLVHTVDQLRGGDH